MHIASVDFQIGVDLMLCYVLPQVKRKTHVFTLFSY